MKPATQTWSLGLMSDPVNWRLSAECVCGCHSYNTCLKQEENAAPLVLVLHYRNTPKSSLDVFDCIFIQGNINGVLMFILVTFVLLPGERMRNKV